MKPTQLHSAKALLDAIGGTGALRSLAAQPICSAAWKTQSCSPEGHKGSWDSLLARFLLLLHDEAPQLLHPCRPELQRNLAKSVVAHLDTFIEGHRLSYAE